MDLRNIKYLMVHCSATRPSQDIGKLEIDKWHRQRGFIKIGYHFVIRRDGSIETGRALGEVGAHCSGQNSASLGICLVGGVTEKDVNKAENNFTKAQWRSLESLIFKLLEKCPQAQVVGHNQFANKACPSFNVPTWWKEVLEGLM